MDFIALFMYNFFIKERFMTVTFQKKPTPAFIDQETQQSYLLPNSPVKRSVYLNYLERDVEVIETATLNYLVSNAATVKEFLDSFRQQAPIVIDQTSLYPKKIDHVDTVTTICMAATVGAILVGALTTLFVWLTTHDQQLAWITGCSIALGGTALALGGAFVSYLVTHKMIDTFLKSAQVADLEDPIKNLIENLIEQTESYLENFPADGEAEVEEEGEEKIAECLELNRLKALPEILRQFAAIEEA
jgi:hypothetical protein